VPQYHHKYLLAPGPQRSLRGSSKPAEISSGGTAIRCRFSEVQRELLPGGRERRWSPRSALLFSGGISLALWAVVAAAVAAALR